MFKTPGAVFVAGAFFLLIAGPVSPVRPPAAVSDSTDYDRWYDALRNAAPDPNRGAVVQNLTITRDEATFELIEGALHLMAPIEGKTVGAVFVGQGRFSMTPPTQIERDQLERFYEAEGLAADIRTAVLFFTDDTMDELAASVDWGPLSPPSGARREIEETLKYVSDDDGWMHRDLMLPMLNGRSGFFYAHVAESRGDPVIFTINPYDFEEVSLSRRAKETRGQVREVVTQFHQRADYEQGGSRPQEALDLVRVQHYDVESTIESNLDFSAVATATLQRVATDHRWIPFSLFSELEVDSLRWADGSAATFHRPKEHSDLWVDFASAPADSTTLTFFYEGDLLDRERDLWVEVRSSTTWYPRYAFWRLATHRLTFHTADKFTLVSVGNQIAETADDEMVTTVWETPPVRQITFNIGEFEDFAVDDPRIPALRVQVAEQAHEALRGMAADANVFLLEQSNMQQMVSTDLANSFAFFNEQFGPTAVNDFVATEIPFSHGEAYPGLVLLSWQTFQWTSEKGFDDMFRAHEVAHQWWGVGVHPATYHDRWLAEGFAEFAGLWYTARARGSTKLFLDRLKETREAIIERRDETAPISLGTRVGDSEHPGDYTTIIYHKGAWVLHMLRNLFVDLDTGSEQAFVDLMNSFYMTYFGQPATTAQFQAKVEEYAGIDMSWFFNQWVHGSSIPTYYFSYNVEELEGGQFKATVRVRQQDVPADFQMLVPILIDFGQQGSAMLRINVHGAVTEQELPILPMKPEKIELNPAEAVLAETKTEGWRN